MHIGPNLKSASALALVHNKFSQCHDQPEIRADTEEYLLATAATVGQLELESGINLFSPQQSSPYNS